MKKYSVLLAMLLACLTAFAGCSDLKIKAGISKPSVSEEKPEEKNDDIKSDNDENSDDRDDDSEQAEEEVSKAEEDQQKKEKSEEAEKTEQEQEDSEAESEHEQKEEQEELENIAEITDIAKIGEELFEKACKMQWDYLIACPYELDYEDTYEYAVRVVGADSLADILEDYNKVFTGERPELKEKYISTQNALYCYDGGRGANIYYQSTDLELVSFEENTAVFEAVSHYADPETDEPMDDKQHTFVIIRTDDEWKVSEFKLPY